MTSHLALWFVPEGAKSAWTLQETHRNPTSYAENEAGTSEPFNVCLTERRLNQLS